MKKMVFLAVLLITGGIFLSSCSKQSSSKVTLKSELDSASYAIGLIQGVSLRNNLTTIPGGECDQDALIAGFIHAMKNDPSAYKMAEREAAAFMQSYFIKLQQNELAVNKEAAAKFLEENRGKEGVQVTESGIQYLVLTEGAGKRPTEESTVKVHYKGMLLDGKEFDSSYEQLEPVEFSLDQVIPGWTEGIQLMPVGSKYKFWIPSDLAYGDQGMEIIPGGALLVFEVELLDITK